MKEILVKNKDDNGQKKCDKTVNISASTESFVMKEIVEKLQKLIIVGNLYDVTIYFQYPLKMVIKVIKQDTYFGRNDIKVYFYKNREFVKFEKDGGKNGKENGINKDTDYSQT